MSAEGDGGFGDKWSQPDPSYGAGEVPPFFACASTSTPVPGDVLSPAHGVGTFDLNAEYGEFRPPPPNQHLVHPHNPYAHGRFGMPPPSPRPQAPYPFHPPHLVAPAGRGAFPPPFPPSHSVGLPGSSSRGGRQRARGHSFAPPAVNEGGYGCDVHETDDEADITSSAKKLMTYLPCWAEHLDEMFKDKTIDEELLEGSPGTSGSNGTGGFSTSGSRKRRISAATKSTASSSSKKEKCTVPLSASTSRERVLSLMQSLMSKMQEAEKKSETVLEKAIEEQKQQKNQANDDVTGCLDLVLDCGFDECSDEYYLCTKLFEKEYNRVVFRHMRTLEARRGSSTAYNEDLRTQGAAAAEGECSSIEGESSSAGAGLSAFSPELGVACRGGWNPAPCCVSRTRRLSFGSRLMDAEVQLRSGSQRSGCGLHPAVAEVGAGASAQRVGGRVGRATLLSSRGRAGVVEVLCCELGDARCCALGDARSRGCAMWRARRSRIWVAVSPE